MVGVQSEKIRTVERTSSEVTPTSLGRGAHSQGGGGGTDRGTPVSYGAPF